MVVRVTTDSYGGEGNDKLYGGEGNDKPLMALPEKITLKAGMAMT